MALVGASGVAAVVLAAGALVAAGWAGASRRLPDAPLRALSAALAVAALARLDLPGPLGVETIVGGVLLVALAGLGLAARGGRAVRVALIVTGGVVAVAAIASAAFGFAALRARDTVERGEAEARRGLSALADGELDEARSRFDDARRLLAAADSRLSKPWTQPARLVPIVAQHRRAVTAVTGGASDAVEQISASLDRIDLDAVRPVDGRVDLAALTSLTTELESMQSVVLDLDARVADADSQWLVGAIQTRLDSLDDELGERLGQADDALVALRQLPQILGADGQRVYFVALTTPAEARGSVGFMGNWAELTVTDGAIEMTAFGREDDLTATGDPAARIITGMPEFLARYGGIGFGNGPGGSAGTEVWQLVTMSPDFPSVGEVVAQLYPVSGGRPIDGVLAIDTKVIAALLEFTGPVEIEGVPQPLTERNAERYLLFDQYVEFDAEGEQRADALEVLGREVFDRLLDGGLPEPIELGRRLAPLARDGHIAMWMSKPAEHDLTVRAGIDRALPQPPGGEQGDAVVIAFNNGTAGKQEVFLDTRVDYTLRPAGDGTFTGEVAITLTNDAPTSGLPDYLIGSGTLVPRGSNRLLVSVYMPTPATAVSLDGEPVEFANSSERGWPVVDMAVVIPSQSTRTFTVEFTGRGPADGEPLVVLPNLPNPIELTVTTEATTR